MPSAAPSPILAALDAAISELDKVIQDHTGSANAAADEREAAARKYAQVMAMLDAAAGERARLVGIRAADSTPAAAPAKAARPRRAKPPILPRSDILRAAIHSALRAKPDGMSAYGLSRAIGQPVPAVDAELVDMHAAGLVEHDGGNPYTWRLVAVAVAA